MNNIIVKNNSGSNDNTMVSYYPPLYKLKENLSLKDDEIEKILSDIEKIILSSASKSDMGKKLGLKLLIRTLERNVFRNFKVFHHLESLELFSVDIDPFFFNDTKELSLAITVVYPPSISTIKTPDNSTIASFILGWLHESNIHHACSVVIVNTDTFL